MKAGRELRAKGKLTPSSKMNGALTPNGSATVSVNGSTAPSPLSSHFPSRIPSPVPSVASSAPSETDADGGAVGRETRRRLVEWWNKEYCAGRMSLCVIGKGGCLGVVLRYVMLGINERV